MDRNEMIRYFSEEVGTTGPAYFGSKAKGLLQQSPVEVADYLLWLAGQDVASYLEVGVCEGELLRQTAKFCPQLRVLEGVDIDHMTNYLMSSDFFFAVNTRRYDVVFIDADHTYEAVKRDFENALRVAEKFIIMHDISCPSCPGVYRLWQEIRRQGCIEFHGGTCGIGVYPVKENKP